MHSGWVLLILVVVLVLLWKIPLVHIETLDDKTRADLRHREKIKEALYERGKIKIAES